MFTFSYNADSKKLLDCNKKMLEGKMARSGQNQELRTTVVHSEKFF